MNDHDRAARFWDEQFRKYSAAAVTARVNPRLSEIAGPLTPGTALDLGCGAGGDARWLADRGWHVTAVDISASAVRSLRQEAEHSGRSVTALCIDLAEDLPAGTFDLVSAQYLHTPFPLDRVRMLRRAARSVNPAGRLAVVDHGSTAPWSWYQDANLRHPTPAEVAEELALDPEEWWIERADSPERRATGPDGSTATVVDHVLVLRRTGQEARR
ncbi:MULTISPECIES: class I SAM-dependent methyltransferase [Actinoalloteichus]|uniref:Methyltransferase domain n=1 Tax=Actinoalloteichus fjordicus TaxID=1612552 RepID=A0AAC9LB88_9PSEU|nr:MULTISPECIES: class I SAM-dependent methyltransferase [Actinoalloteichus]APU14733.1 Methyltransferase domain [Actinoalloteichus fjordicus]APU20701.1 Methyltransferase domain [Actinoalloteichus sp. GBA129-24]